MFRSAARVIGIMMICAASATAQDDAAVGVPAHDAERQWIKLSNKVSIGGYYDFEYEDKERITASTTEAEGDFDQHRFVLFLGANPHERIKLFTELEYEHGAKAADLKLEQAWAEFSLSDNHNLRLGIDLIPVGRYNINHDANLTDFVFRPEIDERLIPTTWYEAGVGLNGNLWTDHLGYQIGISNGMRPSTSVGAYSEFRNMRGSSTLGWPSEDDNNNNKAVHGRLAIKPWLGTEVGLSGYHGTYSNLTNVSSQDSDITYLAIDLSQVWGPFELRGEYVNIDKELQNGSINASGGASGGYLELAYHFFPNFLRDSILGRGFDDPTFTLVGRGEIMDFETQTDPTLLDRNWYSLGFNYRPIEQMAFKFSYDWEDREADGQENQNRFGAGVALGF